MDREQQWIERLVRAPRGKEADLLIGKYYDEIYIYAFKQTFNRELALDLTQEIFIAAIRGIALYDRKKAAFRTWLYSVATNKIIDYRRSRAYSQPPPVDVQTLDLPDETEFTEVTEKKELAGKIEKRISSLEAGRQEIFRLRVYAQYSFAEIALITSMPEATVKTVYYRLTAQLRKEFEDEY